MSSPPIAPSQREQALTKLLELRKAPQPAKVPPVGGPTRIRSAEECLREAASLPPIDPLFGTFWQTGEIAILAADAGLGKSVLSIQVAEPIAGSGQQCVNQPCRPQPAPILVYDFELSDQQFYSRFAGRRFPPGLLRGDPDPKVIDPQFGLEQIIKDIAETGSRTIIIDNITALSLKNTADPDAALAVMRGLKRLQVELGVSSLILAHVPKIPSGVPLHLNHLAGGKALSNFADSVFFLGRSRQGKQIRYLKQVKARNAELPDEPLTLDLRKDWDGLRFSYLGSEPEEEHLEQVTVRNEKQAEKQAMKELVWQMMDAGHTWDEIQEKTGLSRGTLSNYRKEKPSVQ